MTTAGTIRNNLWIIAMICALTLLADIPGFACTSAIVSGRITQSGHPMMWKHRDTSNKDNYVDTVHAITPEFDYIALFNASDSLKKEAWAGVNRCGFAIINTVAGNLPANADDWKDREGIIMTEALLCCKTVDDFAELLDRLPKPLGVRTNFGVMDGDGNGAYFETDDYGYHRYDLNCADSGYLVRSNFSCSSTGKGGYGYERYYSAEKIIGRNVVNGIQPELFTECLSRDYYDTSGNIPHSYSYRKKIKDGKFISRPTSASSVVIEYTEDGPVMWTMLGYPPAAITVPVTFTDIPECVGRNPLTGKSSASERANAMKKLMTDGKHVLFPAATEIANDSRQQSLDNYRQFRSKK